MTNNIPGGLATYVYTGGTMHITYFNDGFCALLGYTREEYEEISDVSPSSRMFAEDRHILKKQISNLIEHDVPVACMYRVHTKDGQYKWLKHRATATDRNGDTVVIHTVVFDVTEEMEYTERLRMSEEEYRLAIQHSGNIIGRYSVTDWTVVMSPDVIATFALPEHILDVPKGPIRAGVISPESVKAYTEFYESINRGSKTGSAIFQRATSTGWSWLEGRYSTIFSDSGEPISAVISFSNITDRLKKESIYNKWEQSLHERTVDSYTLFRCNLNKDSSFDSMEGELLQIDFDESEATFDDRTEEYVKQFVCEEDSERYRAFLKADTLLANYYRGRRTETIEYREKRLHGGVRWLRLTVDLVEYPNSTDIEAYLMYENIDEEKRAELLALARAEQDLLTGTLNRAAFEDRANASLCATPPETQHALLMLDIDGFKLVNDAFGHDVGDQALAEMASRVRAILRKGDLLGRLGGDEFFVFLNHMENDSVAANVAQKICILTKRAFSAEVQISASIGIAIFPRDGKTFSELYKKADMALYHVKGSGKNDYVFYRDGIENENMELEESGIGQMSSLPHGMKRRMLIVSAAKDEFESIAQYFHDQFIVDRAPDGSTALIRLRHYGFAISMVLLDTNLPGMDGFAILQTMRESSEMQNIPVVVYGEGAEADLSLKAIRGGASDFVTKPINPELLRLRVFSAISKFENNHLRVQNDYLQMRNSEVERYQTILKHIGIAVMENDWIRGTFSYDPNVFAYLAGVYDGRKLWRILLSDMVADTATVQLMQRTLQQIAGDRECMKKEIYVQLKTPSLVKHWFRMTVYKINNEYQLTEKMILTFMHFYLS